jgi:FixJ family two-component response regulator
MKAGAIDFLLKPVDSQALLAAVDAALARDAAARETQSAHRDGARRLASLTPRERQVLDLVVAGRLNKQVAAELGTAEKTVKVHRGRMMKKLGVRTVADLVRLVSALRS